MSEVAATPNPRLKPIKRNSGKKRLRLLMIVDDPAIATFVSKNGVDRLFVDLERTGKQERQAHLASWKSEQTMDDVAKIREAAPEAHLLVRIDPFSQNTRKQINEVIARGADSVMLPMFRLKEELAGFFDLLRGRCQGVPLFETSAALDMLPNCIEALPLTEVHIGLNDLHIDRGDRFMFEPLADGALEEPCAALRESGISFGIGGVARATEGGVSPEFLLGEHVRLGSSAAILSRTFHRGAQTLEQLSRQVDFEAEIQALQSIYDAFLHALPEDIEQNRRLTHERIRQVASSLFNNDEQRGVL
ncbi:MAG: hypothetical protein J0I69_10360 [Altererythrobacter sp.]|nr:hypothetical protein [Altererythrobacter sp.]